MRAFFTLFFIVFAISFARGQLRHVKGIDDVGISLSVSYHGYGGELFYEKYLSNTLILKLGGYLDRRDIGYSDYIGYGIIPQIYKTVLNNKRNLFLNINAGANIGYESARSEVTTDRANSFVIGQRVGVSIEYFVFPGVKFEIQGSQYFMQRSQFLKYGQIYSIALAYRI